jgi:hypothetical protein
MVRANLKTSERAVGIIHSNYALACATRSVYSVEQWHLERIPSK